MEETSNSAESVNANIQNMNDSVSIVADEIQKGAVLTNEVMEKANAQITEIRSGIEAIAVSIEGFSRKAARDHVAFSVRTYCRYEDGNTGNRVHVLEKTA